MSPRRLWPAAPCRVHARSSRPPPRARGRRSSWAAVLVAGDGSIPVFDNATGRMADLLEAVGTRPGDIHRFSAAPDMLAQPHVQLASKARVLDAHRGTASGTGARRASCS